MAGDEAVTVTVAGTQPGSHASDLLEWLQQSAELRGCVDVLPSTPDPGKLGAPDTLIVVLATASCVKAFKELLSLWVDSRRTTMAVGLRRGDDSVTLTATGVRHADVEPTLSRVGRFLDGGCAPGPDDDRAAGASPRD
jgi:Effector Associated Constant Component 1